MEYYIVYDKATGSVVFRAAVQAGLGMTEDPGVGRAILFLPISAFAPGGNDIDLATLKAALLTQLDLQAEVARQPYITRGEGQAMTYQKKSAEAQAYSRDADASIPFIAAEATACGMTVEALVADIMQQLAVWTYLGSRIEAARRAAKMGVSAASTTENALKLGTVDWSTVADLEAAIAALSAPEIS